MRCTHKSGQQLLLTSCTATWRILMYSRNFLIKTQVYLCVCAMSGRRNLNASLLQALQSPALSCSPYFVLRAHGLFTIHANLLLISLMDG